MTFVFHFSAEIAELLKSGSVKLQFVFRAGMTSDENDVIRADVPNLQFLHDDPQVKKLAIFFKKNFSP